MLCVLPTILVTFDNKSSSLASGVIIIGLYLTGVLSVGVTLWTFTYMYRVASKDMTYTKQLKDYEVSELSIPIPDTHGIKVLPSGFIW